MWLFLPTDSLWCARPLYNSRQLSHVNCDIAAAGSGPPSTQPRSDVVLVVLLKPSVRAVPVPGWLAPGRAYITGGVASRCRKTRRGKTNKMRTKCVFLLLELRSLCLKMSASTVCVRTCAHKQHTELFPPDININKTHFWIFRCVLGYCFLCLLKFRRYKRRERKCSHDKKIRQK